MTDRERGDRTETLVALRALSAKWRRDADRAKLLQGLDCADELDAKLSALVSRAAQGETPIFAHCETCHCAVPDPDFHRQQGHVIAVPAEPPARAAQGETPAIAHLATAMKKMLPPALLDGRKDEEARHLENIPEFTEPRFWVTPAAHGWSVVYRDGNRTLAISPPWADRRLADNQCRVLNELFDAEMRSNRPRRRPCCPTTTAEGQEK